MAAITMRELAASLGVHLATVSRALDPDKSHLVNEQTRLRVVEAAQRSGYTQDVGASSLRTGRTYTIGLVTTDLGNEILVETMRSITAILESHHYTPLISETLDDSARLTRVTKLLQGRRVDAVITTAAREADRATLTTLSKRVPVVLAVRRLTNSTLPTVHADDIHIGALAANHLADQGHRRVLQICGPMDTALFQDRRRGFTAACSERGLVELGPGLGLHTDHASAAEGWKAMDQVLSRSNEYPTAVFSHNDALAFGALERMPAAGLRCPHDIAMIGCNNTSMARQIAVPLSSIVYPADIIGRRAAALALQLIEGGYEPGTVETYAPSLVIRESTARVGSAPA